MSEVRSANTVKNTEKRKRQDLLHNSQMHSTVTVETTQESIKNIRLNKYKDYIGKTKQKRRNIK